MFGFWRAWWWPRPGDLSNGFNQTRRVLFALNGNKEPISAPGAGDDGPFDWSPTRDRRVRWGSWAVGQKASGMSSSLHPTFAKHQGCMFFANMDAASLDVLLTFQCQAPQQRGASDTKAPWQAAVAAVLKFGNKEIKSARSVVCSSSAPFCIAWQACS